MKWIDELQLRLYCDRVEKSHDLRLALLLSCYGERRISTGPSK